MFDLFGTLVTAPTPEECAQAAERLATVIGCAPATVERYFRHTWRVRHDGTLATLTTPAAHAVRAGHGPDTAVRLVADELRGLGRARLVPAPSVVYALKSLRGKGVQLGILSDASAEIAAVWPRSPLSALVDAAVFSCEAGTVKPDHRLYRHICDKLHVPAHRTLYVGDGGGDELRGALAAGMTVAAVRRCGPVGALAFGDTDWSGPLLGGVEHVPAYLAEQA